VIIIGLTDVHGSIASIERMNKIINKADVVFFVGDITNFGREKETAHVVAPVLERAKKVLAVSGNCDYKEVDNYLDSCGINLHGAGETVDGIGFVGLGGSLITPFNTPNELTEDEIAHFLNQGHDQIPPDIPMVLVSHQPPLKTNCDRLSSGDHVGSETVRRFIEKHHPLVCFTGHIHESTGMDQIGDTVVINPGLLANGQYAYAKIGDGLEEIEIRTF
jgi:uncharacterized protein